MRNLFIFLFIILLPTLAFALINGKPLDGSPDFVRIVFNNGWICSGTFIDPYTILTAAHCLITDEPNTPLHIDKILSDKDTPLPVHEIALIPDPLFSHQRWPAHDLGIIKTSLNPNFTNEFHLARSLENFRGKSILLGAGKIDISNAVRQRRMGENTFTRVGSVLFFFGVTKESPVQGVDVTVAPNDSGGPVLMAGTHEIIGVLTTTTAQLSSQYDLPALSTATSTVTRDNLDFILTHQ